MAKKKHKNETVSISFHFLYRKGKDKNDRATVVPFTLDEFESLFSGLQRQQKAELSDPETVDRLRYRAEVLIEKLLRINDRTISGTFRAAYWGHAYDNTVAGHIPADSLSMRPFHFLLYLSKNGKIYIATQYLGQFGGYMALKTMVTDLLPKPESIAANSFRIGPSYFKDLEPKEVRVSFSNKPKEISSKNSFTDSGMITFKKRSKDDGFENQVTTRFLPFIGKGKPSIRKGIARILNESDLIDVEDSEIEDCSIVASINGRKKTIYLLESGNFATKYPIEVPLDSDGHPEYESTRKEILKILQEEIISKKENV